MKTKYIFSIVALALGLTACENYFDEKYMDNGNPQIAVVKTYTYTLTSSDYGTISKNKTNLAIAERLDSVEGMTTYHDALERIGKDKRFDTIGKPSIFAPAFLLNKYPHLDNGSVIKLTYQIFDGFPEFMLRYKRVAQYTLSSADYQLIWGNPDTKYITPATIGMIAEVLPMVDDDEMLGVVYNYSSKEPGEGGAVEETHEVIYIYKSGLVWMPVDEKCVVLLPKEANGDADKWVDINYPYAQKKDSLIIMNYNTKSKLYDATEYKHDGEKWNALTGVSEETVSYGLEDLWAEMPIYYRQALAGEEDQGAIVIQDFDMQEGINYIWTFTSNYGMKGTAYYGGPHYGEGWFITPAITLKNSNEPAVSFDHAVNYGPTDTTRYRQLTVWVSTDYVDDVRSAEWTQLPWPDFGEEGVKSNEEEMLGFPATNSWTFFKAARMDLSAWNGETIRIGFRYKTLEGETCPTWEVKNIIVNEP